MNKKRPNQKNKIIQKGNVYFFYRPKIEKEGIQRFFFVLKPEKKINTVYW